MQIFFVSDSPKECARYLDDRRVIKILLETAQMLSTALRWRGIADDNLYQSFNPNHPICKWVRLTRGNFKWTLDYHRALCLEYRLRFKKTHSTDVKFDTGRYFLPYLSSLPNAAFGVTPFPNCAANAAFGLDFRQVTPTTQAYRDYLRARWRLECDSGRPPLCSFPPL